MPLEKKKKACHTNRLNPYTSKGTDTKICVKYISNSMKITKKIHYID